MVATQEMNKPTLEVRGRFRWGRVANMAVYASDDLSGGLRLTGLGGGPFCQWLGGDAWLSGAANDEHENYGSE